MLWKERGGGGCGRAAEIYIYGRRGKCELLRAPLLAIHRGLQPPIATKGRRNNLPYLLYQHQQQIQFRGPNKHQQGAQGVSCAYRRDITAMHAGHILEESATGDSGLLCTFSLTGFGVIARPFLSDGEEVIVRLCMLGKNKRGYVLNVGPICSMVSQRYRSQGHRTLCFPSILYFTKSQRFSRFLDMRSHLQSFGFHRCY